MRIKRKLDLIDGMSTKLSSVVLNMISIIILIVLTLFITDVLIIICLTIIIISCSLFAIRDYRNYKYLKKILDGK